jgi:hypothetical protein
MMGSFHKLQPWKSGTHRLMYLKSLLQVIKRSGNISLWIDPRLAYLQNPTRLPHTSQAVRGSIPHSH